MKTLLAAAAIAAAFVVPAEAAAKKSVAVKQPAINAKAAIARAKSAIVYTLKDPESVRWRTASVDDYGNVCIGVNAKNSYGGYTGFQPMHYNGRYGTVTDGDEAYGACLGMKWRGKYVRFNVQ